MSGYLKTGHRYTLRDLFITRSNGKIVIPDLQRDYCWGTNGNLVHGFVGNILDHFKKCRGENVTMGMVYGYYESQRPYLQLCDGQQRITTLYLLVGIINRVCPDSEFRDILISGYELDKDDKEPNLLYGVRDSTLYFLTDLVSEYFLSHGEMDMDSPVSQEIRNQSWWLSAYALDPSVESILAAMDFIQDLLRNEHCDLWGFGQYVISKLQFIFVDMVGRKNGEETFVVINTTGEPLTASENLKPLIVQSDGNVPQNSARWEEIDHYFWKHRNKAVSDTSDDGLYEFLRWAAAIWICTDGTKLNDILSNDRYDFPVGDVRISQVYDVYKAVRDINSDNSIKGECGLLSVPLAKRYNLNDYFVILPTLLHYIKFRQKSEVVRVYRFFNNLRRYTTVSNEGMSIANALAAVEMMPNADIVSLLDVKESVSRTVVTDEEERKLTLLGKYKDNSLLRKEIEDEFERAARHEVWNGQISCLLSWCISDGEFNLKDFKKYVGDFENMYKIVAEGQNNQYMPKIVLSMYALKMKAYPREWGYRYSFGRYVDDWRGVVKEQSNWQSLKMLLDTESSDTIIENWLCDPKTRDDRFFGLLKNYAHGRLCHDWNKIVSVEDAGNRMLRLHAGYNRGGSDIFIWHGCLMWLDNDAWTGFRVYRDLEDGHYCLYTDHKEYNIAIDIMVEHDENGKYIMRVFNRPQEESAGRKDYMLSQLDLDVDCSDGGYNLYYSTEQDLFTELKWIMEHVA